MTNSLYIYIYIYIYIIHNIHFVYIYFFIPFELPYWSYDAQGELVDRPFISRYFPNHGTSSKEVVLQKRCYFCLYIMAL